MLVGLGLTKHRKSIIFRREYPQLKDIIEYSREVVGDRGKFNANENIWRLDDGRTLEFGAVQHATDISKWRGRPHDFKGFDELTEFEESQYRSLIGWARTAVPGQRVRIVSTCNPSPNWVYKRWQAWLDPTYPNRAVAGEIRWFIGDEEVAGSDPIQRKSETLHPRSRTFIPGSLKDNPFLSANNDYLSTLQSLPEPLRSQLLLGDWLAGKEDSEFQVIPRAWVHAAQERWKFAQTKPLPSFTGLGVDVGRTGDKTAIAVRRGNVVQEVIYLTNADTMQVAAKVAQMLNHERGWARVDTIGVGAGVYDRLNQLGYSTDAFNASEAGEQIGQLTFANKRAWSWWALREMLDPTSGQAIALPPDQLLTEELCMPIWSQTANGKIKVESKDELRKRLGRSTDAADAVIMALMEFKPARKPIPGRPMTTPIG